MLGTLGNFFFTTTADDSTNSCYYSLLLLLLMISIDILKECKGKTLGPKAQLFHCLLSYSGLSFTLLEHFMIHQLQH